MRSVGANTVNYLNGRAGLITRYFVWLIAKDRTTGADQSAGFWNGPYPVSVTVVSGQTGVPETRDYVGAGSLISVDDINLVSDMTIQTLRVKLTQTNSSVNNAIRGYDARNGKIEVHYGLLDKSTRLLVDTPYPHFVGTVNKVALTRGKAGSSGGVGLECVSRNRELTIINPAKKSDETQKLRTIIGGGPDRLRKYINVTDEWSIWWGELKNDK